MRQILRRLNVGPWVPALGRRPWAPSTVHHILSDPVYTGTAYANRYEYVDAEEAARAASRATTARAAAGCGRASSGSRSRCRRWSDQETWDRAQAQLARNALLSFRNNTEAQLPAALPADLRRLRAGHARRRPRPTAGGVSGATTAAPARTA